MRPLRFIHAADLHLDSPFTGMKGLPEDRRDLLRNSTFEAFDRLVSYAAESKPDFLLIAGDLYDGEDRSIRAQHRFRTGMQKLSDAGIPVFISHGNHDHLSGSWTRFGLPGNVRVFDEEVEQFTLEAAGHQVRITGFSYPKRHVAERMIERYPKAAGDSIIHIGMLHGSLEGDTAHAVYAPFRKDELLAKGYDYWALGHIHHRQVLHRNPHIVYPGNLQGRHRNESGPKGFYDVTLDGPETVLRFIPAGPVVFDSVQVDGREARDLGDVLALCAAAADRHGEQSGAGVLDFTLINAPEFVRSDMAEEIAEALRAEIPADRDPFLWVSKFRIERPAGAAELSGLGAKVSEMLESWDEASWQEALGEVYRHIRGGRYLGMLSPSLIEEIKDEAQKKLKDELGAGG
ncbi:metallophosphoesterase family protein [Indiicoccus explosivorum]|uniref:metallophosphoesterase family protein n=1 Tax=Indiicoccus explosivorum TaxID=1917864 RepID=UPI000B431BE3|nr:DNA repair exonuclease [Indiicoccus explosivorum]